MASSSSQINHHQLPNLHGGATAAPPPTPSCTHPNTTTTKSETAADALSRLFINRLPPNLSLPNRRSSSAAKSSSSAASLPTVSISAENHNDLISAATEFGYFQLANDSETINIIIAEAAESDSLSLLDLNEEKKESSFPKNWPFGYDSDTETPSFCLDSNCNSTESSELKLSSLRELTRSLEKIGLETVEMLAKAFGFKNPFNEPDRFSTMMWLNQSFVDGDDKPEITDGFYPFVVCLLYQIREQKSCLLSESGWVSVSPRVDSVLVTLGDIAQGLVNAVQKVIPEVEHRMCSRHILANWKRDSKSPDLERMFWRIAKSYTVGDYEDGLQALRAFSPGAYDSLLKTKPETWARAFFRIGSCCNDNLNNLSESFNKTIREARKKPLLDLLEDIRRQCMVRNAKRGLIAKNLKTRFTKRAHTEIELTKEKAKDCHKFTACGNMHEVDYLGTAYSVDMNNNTCGCIKWQLTGIPCIHVACVIMAKKQRVGDFVNDYFLASKFRITYSRGINPVQGMKLWPRKGRLPVLPPPYRLGNRGRPSNYDRKKSANEATSTSKTHLDKKKRLITCSNCEQVGHNKITCSNPTAEKGPKRPVGRPRLYEVWCNGEIKRVRYRPVLCSGQLDGTRKCVTMTLMLTLPMDTMVSPLKGINEVNKEEEEYGEEEEGGARSEEKMVFKSFDFEDYAWRVYHERFFFKDPLDRYKIKY